MPITRKTRGAAALAKAALAKGHEIHPDYRKILDIFSKELAIPVIEHQLLIDFYASLLLEEI